ncbi:hypothetical protein [Paraburkholderia ferrariae]|uniref:Uncharacterized protein n=1 Tax=Paraburkholderia ferrariae TaxID=386056 RepID=A0ABU9RIG9_9BURK
MDIEDLNPGEFADALAAGMRSAVTAFVEEAGRMPTDTELHTLAAFTRGMLAASIANPNGSVVDTTLERDADDPATARLTVLFDDGSKVRFPLALAAIN